MRRIIQIVCVFLLGFVVDILCSKIGWYNGATIYLAVVVVECTHMILRKIDYAIDPNKPEKPGLIRKFIHRLYSEVNNGREKPNDDNNFIR